MGSGIYLQCIVGKDCMSTGTKYTIDTTSK